MSDHEFTLSTARQASERDDLSRWVHEFLSSDGSDNAALADALAEQDLWWVGPIELPLDQLHRLAGPPGEPTLARFEDDDLEVVESMRESIEEGWEAPPLIVAYRNRQLVVEDGTHRVEGLRRAGIERGWSLVCFEDRSQRDSFDPAALREPT